MKSLFSRIFQGVAILLFSAVIISFLWIIQTIAATERYNPIFSKSRLIESSPVIDGSFVHNVGKLQMNVTNWGIIGSMPGSGYPMRDVASAQYPAGSGVEYLFAAGVWIGAKRGGIPIVSTGYPEDEFRPKQDHRNTIYKSFEGDIRGDKYPGNPDDDRDGRIDEDFPNGYDDDGDGKIDEDFAAVGNQYLTCEYTDAEPVSKLLWPEHEPMHVRVRQETFQWGEEAYYDMVGIRYTITNQGLMSLNDIYVGIYADLDAGPRSRGTYHMDDQVGFWSGRRCVSKGVAEYPKNISVAYVYDDDGDDGQTPGYFGIAFLGQITSDINPYLPGFPAKLLGTFKVFRGLQPYADGGDATNDFERYELLSDRNMDDNTQDPGDYRILLSCGPFTYLGYNMSIHVDFAFVAGNSFDDMLDHAAVAQLLYDGLWFDLDRNKDTGVIGRESFIIGQSKAGEEYDPDPCDDDEEKVRVALGETLWVNRDCYEERIGRDGGDCYVPVNIHPSHYITGIDGKEHNLHWVTGSAPPPPNVRVVGGNRQVEVYWDDLSETTPDIILNAYDFEGYQIWRADEWDRPLGTSVENGPSLELWTLLEERDLVNGISPDRDFKSPCESGGWEYSPMSDLPDREMLLSSFQQSLIYAPLDTVPCPPGLTQEECDTLEAVARFSLGYEGGKKYYRYIDDSVKNGMHYFYAVVSYDHKIVNGQPYDKGRYNSPSGNFQYVVPVSGAQEAEEYDDRQIYVVPNPVTTESMSRWELGPTNDDPSGVKLEIRNLPACRSTIRIYTISGDLVVTLHHDGSSGNGTVMWNLVSRNGQDITSGVYIFAVEPADEHFERSIGRFVVIR